MVQVIINSIAANGRRQLQVQIYRKEISSNAVTF